MSDYTEFFLGTPSAVVELDCIEISHPDFKLDYFIVRNHAAGVTVTLEDATSRTYKYYPVDVRPLGFKDDMDQGFSVSIGDTGDTLPDELQAVDDADGFATFPTFVYRSYRSDDLTKPLYGPVNLRIKKITMAKEGATFEAQAPKMNDGRTGELYRIDRFPMMRGLMNS